MFKIVNLAIHIGNVYLIYKLSGKKLFTIVYGLNPFILIEGIANVHNDLYMVFFILLALFEILKRKKLVPSLLFLAIATDIKYFAILLLPLIIIYYYKDKDIKTRIIKCIEYGIIFLIMAFIPYLIFFRDLDVFLGLFDQRERMAKGLYLFIAEYFNKPKNIISILKNTSLALFGILFCCTCINLIMEKKIKFNLEMRKLYLYMLAFLFLLITNFQPWYFIWLSAFIIWQKAQNIRLIVQMQILTLFANMVFLVYSENYRYGVPFFVIYVIRILVCIIINQKYKIKKMVSYNRKIHC